MWWATLALASPTHPCAGPVESARRSSDPLVELLDVDAACHTSAWHDAMGTAFERAEQPGLAAWHFAQCASDEDHLQDVCLMSLARAAQKTGSPLDVRELVIDVAPDALRPEQRDYLLWQQGLARLDDDRPRDAQASFEAIDPRSTWSLHGRLARARLAEDAGRRRDALELYSGLVQDLDRGFEGLASAARVGAARMLATADRHEEVVGLLAGQDSDEARLVAARSWLALDEPRTARSQLAGLQAWWPEADALIVRSYCGRYRSSILLSRTDTALESRLSELRPILRNATASTSWEVWRETRWGLAPDAVLRIASSDRVRQATAGLDALVHEIDTADPWPAQVGTHVDRTLTTEHRRRRIHAGDELTQALAQLAAEAEATLRDLRGPGVCP